MDSYFCSWPYWICIYRSFSFRQNICGRRVFKLIMQRDLLMFWLSNYWYLHHYLKLNYLMWCDHLWLPILRICALHLTHPRCTHSSAHTQQWIHIHLEQWAAILCCSRENLGVPWLAQGHLSRGIEGGERALYIHSPHPQSLPARDSNSHPFDHESTFITISPQLPLC